MITLYRAQIRDKNKVINPIDITVRSAIGWAKQLAPTWDMVMGHKNKKINNKQYEDQYIARLKLLDMESIISQMEQIGDRITFICYCNDGDFCHTYLLIDYLCRYYPSLCEKDWNDNKYKEI